MGSLLRLVLCAYLLVASGWLASSALAMGTSSCLDSTGSRQRTNSHMQRGKRWLDDDAAAPSVRMSSSSSPPRRSLAGPGSRPPRCTSKCGSCTPCVPVHVPVPPDAHAVTEYYPEAWRCKCGNRLYMP